VETICPDAKQAHAVGTMEREHLTKEGTMKRMDVVGGAMVAVMLGAPLLALQQSPLENAKRTACASNLRSLWQACFNYAAQYGRPNGIMQTETGSDFWLKLRKTPKPLLDKVDPLFCPLAGHDQAVEQTSFRGPASDVNKIGDEDPVGADFDGNHGPKKGGNVILKHGGVTHYADTDAVWVAAAQKTTGKEPVKKQDPKSPAALEKRIEALEKAVKELTELVKQMKEQLDKQAK
jgi:hypothetical protein